MATIVNLDGSGLKSWRLVSIVRTACAEAVHDLRSGFASLTAVADELPVLVAGPLLASLPAIVVFIILQTHMINGIVVSGVNG